MDYKKLLSQIIKFGGVGALCTVIDFVVLHILTEYVGVHVLISAAAAFSVSVVINYYLSVKLVFDVSDGGRTKKFILFIIFSVIGLIITEIIMKIGVDIFTLNYILVKVISTGIVMVFNFITRKLFLEKK